MHACVYERERLQKKDFLNYIAVFCIINTPFQDLREKEKVCETKNMEVSAIVPILY